MLYPRSVFRLTLIALLVVALPLCAVLLAVVLSVERQADIGQKAVLEAMATNRASRNMLQRLAMVQRQAQHYVLLGEAEKLDLYLEARDGVVESMTRLQGLVGTGPDRESLDQLVAAEAEVHSKLARFLPGDDNPLGEHEQSALLKKGTEVVTRMENQVTQRLERMEAAANEPGRELLGPVLLVLPLTAVLALVSTLMIVRPIRRMERAVKDLGEGRFDTPIVIKGPGDIARLGEQLDWMRQRLNELEQQKARFLGHVSHELKTPLTAIRESAELLSDGSLGPLGSQQYEVADIMRENSVKLQGLIEGLLNFNVRTVRGEHRKTDVVQLDRVASQVLATHGPMLHKKHLKLDEDLHTARLRGDEDGLAVVIDNLVSNAIKYSPSGGTVKVGVKSDGRRVVLDVRDQGPGIDHHDRKRVFEAFFQGRPPDGECVPGTGLGLSIAAEHVAAHGGELSLIDSNPRGRTGAHLRAVFPIDTASVVGEVEGTALPAPSSRWREREEQAVPAVVGEGRT